MEVSWFFFVTFFPILFVCSSFAHDGVIFFKEGVVGKRTILVFI